MTNQVTTQAETQPGPASEPERKRITNELLMRPCPAAIISKMDNGVPYITKENLVTLLNSLFGPQGWRVVFGEAGMADMRQTVVRDFEGREKHTWCATAWANATVTLHGRDGDIVRGGHGADKAFNPDPGSAITNAHRSAATSALKRAAALFGPILGGELGTLNYDEAIAAEQKWLATQKGTS